MVAPYKDRWQARDKVEECNKFECSLGVCTVSATVHCCVRSNVLRASARRLVIGVCGGSRFARTVLWMSESAMRFRLVILGSQGKIPWKGRSYLALLVVRR
jgi:hypothetical protein